MDIDVPEKDLLFYHFYFEMNYFFFEQEALLNIHAAAGNENQQKHEQPVIPDG